MKKLNSIKYRIIGEALKNTNDPFEKMRCELLFVSLIAWFPLHTLSIIPMLVNGHWFLLAAPVSNLISIIVSMRVIQKTGEYYKSALIWVVASILSTIFTTIISGATLSGVIVLWQFMCIISAFIFLGKKGGIIAFFIYSVIILLQSLTLIELIPPFEPEILANDRIVFTNPNLFHVIIPLSFSGYILFQFLSTLSTAQSDLENQKKQIAQAHQEIKDSINYAKYIQTAILPPSKLLKKYLKQLFILYKPKDTVSGDFYWIEPTDEEILFAVCDCTGHGVPGAMVSVICNQALNRSIREFKLTDPGHILDKTREIVLGEFEQSEQDVNDGMDIALCALNGNQLKFAGAYIPIWIIRKNSSEVEVVKANRQPVGKFDKVQPFQTHQIEVNKGDSIYIFSDGFVDQFGGEYDKKFMSSNLKKLLLSIQNEPMEKQHQSLNQAFENWKGENKQMDDVCVMGVRI